MKKLILVLGILGSLAAQADVSVGTVGQIACKGEVVLSSKNPKCLEDGYAVISLNGPAVGKDAFLFSARELSEIGHNDSVSVLYNPKDLVVLDIRKHSCEAAK